MKVLVSLFILLLNFASGATTSSLPQNEQRASSETKSLRRQLARNDWELVGQGIYTRSISVAPYELQSISVADENESNPNFLNSLQLAPEVSVYYELTPALHISAVEEMVVVPRKMSFSSRNDSLVVFNGEENFEMSYFLQFPPDQPDVVVLHLRTVIDKPEESRIFGELRMQGNELLMVQDFGSNSQIRWIFKKAQ